MNHQPKGIGWIEVICGSMFSGKTEELIRRIKRALIARQVVQVFKPTVDDRYHKTAIVSHDKRKIESIAVGDAVKILELLDSNTEVVGIDEAQFFGKGVLGVVEELANRGVRVVITGLDQDYLGQPFSPMPELLAISEYITKTLAICVKCGNPANRSFRLVGEGNRVEIGADEKYEARCRKCYLEGRNYQKRMAKP